MTWASTPNMIVLAGATPVWVDIDTDTLMTTAERVEAALTEKTKLIIPVHFAGAPADLEPLRALASRRGIPLVEDSAHVAGAAYAGEKLGARGTSIFSLHPIKNFTTGEGGIVCTDSEELAARVRRLRFHGLGRGHVPARDPRTRAAGRGHRARLQVQPARHERGARLEPARAARRDEP